MKKALSIGIGLKQKELDDSLIELEGLAISLDFEVIHNITQISPMNRLPLYFGKGKFAQVVEFFANNLDIKTLLVNDELKAFQTRNMMKELAEYDVKVIDRSRLILDIFSIRAHSSQAKIQVEITNLKYHLTHLVKNDENYDQQGGSSTLASKGSGEKQISLDRSIIKDKINLLKNELKEINKTNVTQRKNRLKSEIPLVSLVGYTNAGKSSLLNMLVDQDNKSVLVADMLFATLDTSVRQVALESNKSILVSDTIGFIDKLPHNLIEAFKATLEEALYADIILHVIDFSNPLSEMQIRVTNETLKSIGVDLTKTIYIYNKCDLTSQDYPLEKDNALYIASNSPSSITFLKEYLYQSLYSDLIMVQKLMKYDDYFIIDVLSKESNIKIIENTNDGVIISAMLSSKQLSQYQKYFIEIPED